jgi:hypothetical protein
LRDVGDGPEKIASATACGEVKGVAQRVIISAVASAIVTTTPFVLLP